MAVKMQTYTVLYVHGAFHVSNMQWRSPRDGHHAQPEHWQWCGSPGWFASEAGRRRYETLKQYVDLHGWSDGEWDEFEAPSGIFTPLTTEVRTD